jgi:aspartyl-tRNA(Asn)/glutamyl-tRNA(Gln) amidotransferase subunit A
MAGVPDEIYFASIPEIAKRLRAREFRAIDVARAFGDRIERLAPRYNALALSLREDAIKRARAIDDEIKRGRFRSMLQGVPFGVKDLLALQGQPTTWGAKPYAAQVFDYTATVVNRLDRTGGLLMAKLSMVELAGGPGYRFANASLQGPGLNPWDRSRWSGGSSSGSGSAVAAGLVTYALGSETSGSILTPSAFCGLTGLRPTYGLVSRHGAMALSWTLDKIGPMCRSAEDCGLVLQTIAGGDGQDPASAGKSFYYAPEYARAFADLTVGYAPADFSDWTDPEARPAMQQAFADMKALGFKLKEVRLPEFPYGELVNTIISGEAGSIFETLISSGKVDELADAKQIAGLKAGLELPAKDYLRAMRVRTLVQDAIREIFASIDVLLTPTRFSTASKISEPLDRGLGDRPMPQDRGLSALIPAGNLAGIPALSLPCGFANGLPMGICLVGRPFSEMTLLSIGREYQSRTNHHKQHPKAG